MSQLRICSSAFLTFSALLLPAALHAGQRGLSCDQLRAELARQAQALKQQHADEMAQCEAASGRQSQTCQDLSERQKEEMRQLNESTLLRLRGCNYSSMASLPLHHVIYYQSAVYPYRHHYHHHHHYNDHDGDGHHGHNVVRADNKNVHGPGEHEVRAAHHVSAGSSPSAGAHSNLGHVAGSLGHNGVEHSGFGTTWHGGSVYAAGTNYTGGHVGSYSTGGGAMLSGGHGASYSGGYSGGFSGGGSVSSGHSGGFSGGSSMSSGSSSSSSSSSGSSGGHVK